MGRCSFKEKENKKIIVIGGPTACGKSLIAFLIAKEINGEIISADSRLFYREINIGTDKPPLWMRQEIPHHMIDILSIKEDFNIYNFSKMVFNLTEEILKKGKIPLIVGGSGLYLRSLINGIFEISEKSKEKQKEIREFLERKDTEQLYEELKKIDPEAAGRIHPNDRRRIRRAVEVYYLTGRPISLMQKDKPEKTLRDFGEIFYFILSRPREILYRRITERIERMLKEGWIEEVKRLKENGYEKLLREKAPIGYSEILDFLDGKIDKDRMKNLIIKKTKGLARRQLTWFRKENGIWIEVKDEEETAKKIIDILKNGEGLYRGGE